MNKLTNTKMREFLKKHKLNKYYEHIPYVIYKMCSNAAPPTISKEDEERLCNAFKQIQGPFAESPNAKKRKNFLSKTNELERIGGLKRIIRLVVLQDCEMTRLRETATKRSDTTC